MKERKTERELGKREIRKRKTLYSTHFMSAR